MWSKYFTRTVQQKTIKPTTTQLTTKFNSTLSPYISTTIPKRYTYPTSIVLSTAAGIATEHHNKEKPSFSNFLLHQGDNATTTTKWQPEYGPIYQFHNMRDIDDKQYDFEQLKGKVVVITNVACDCGFTSKAYQNLVQWQNEHGPDGTLQVIGFPSNTFEQEKRSPAEIKQYVTEKFGLNFPLMAKSDVNGPDTNIVYKYLKKSLPGDILWNFGVYFVIDHNGIPIARFEKESWADIKSAIDTAVKNAKEHKNKPIEQQKVV